MIRWGLNCDCWAAGDFIGRAGWRRISEVWPAPSAEIIDEAIEAAARLADYVIALEPVRRTARVS